MRYSDDEYEYGDAISEHGSEPSEYISDEDLDAYNERLDYHIDEYYTRCYGTDDVNFDVEPEKWVWFRLGDAAVQVSDQGKIRCPRLHYVTEGFAVPGTPYRSYPLYVNKDGPATNMYVHDIIWRAFNGEVPNGYDVRHNMWVVKSRVEKYPNNLASLDIYVSLNASTSNTPQE